MRTLICLTLAATLSFSGCKRAHQLVHHAASSEPNYTPQLQSALTSGHIDDMQFPDFTDIQPQVMNFYDGRDFDAVWIQAGKPTPQADAMLENFSNAIKRGLRPADYDAGKWQARVANLKSPEGVALFDATLTINAMRYLSDLHMGRVTPAYFTFGVKGYDDKKLDLTAALAPIVTAKDVDAALDSVEPQADQYRALKSALAHYLDLVPQDHIAPLPDIDAKAKPAAVTADYNALQPLVQRLQLLGDLQIEPNSTPDPATLAEAITRFQHRHGIAEDGKLAHDTVAALNVPITARVTQIQDSMERWRWLSDDYQNAAIMVNLPEFELRAYEGTGVDRHETFRMEVVDGKSDDETHHTPIIADQMKYLVFRPYWNVPPSIARKEIIPHMEKSSDYLSQKNYETVNMKGDIQPPQMSLIEKGQQMVRQKSGTSNSLGLVKFMFPNSFNVYLHDTNEKALFSRTRRDYSHGCVRLQDPPKLAEWVLRNNPKWDADAIKTAMETGDDNKSVSLGKPLPIVIFYVTALSDSGEIHFFRDMYDYDSDLEKVLTKGRPYPTKPVKQVSEKDV